MVGLVGCKCRIFFQFSLGVNGAFSKNVDLFWSFWVLLSGGLGKISSILYSVDLGLKYSWLAGTNQYFILKFCWYLFGCWENWGKTIEIFFIRTFSWYFLIFSPFHHCVILYRICYIFGAAGDLIVLFGYLMLWDLKIWSFFFEGLIWPLLLFPFVSLLNYLKDRKQSDTIHLCVVLHILHWFSHCRWASGSVKSILLSELEDLHTNLGVFVQNRHWLRKWGSQLGFWVRFLGI